MKSMADYIGDSKILLDEYGEIAQQLITDNPDWTRVCDLLLGYIAAIAISDLGKRQEHDIWKWFAAITYAMGYERGKRAKGMPNFVVAPEMEGDDSNE